MVPWFNDEVYLNYSEPYRDFLNWASQHNPDGVDIVRNLPNQGNCDSCWAFVAKGVVESAFYRAVRYDTYKRTMEALQSTYSPNKAITYRKSIKAAQEFEEKIFREVDLSVQELIDCDGKYNLNCYGGNPSLAFYFIERHGLTSSFLYPYQAKLQTCQHNLVCKPVAKITSWKMLPSDYDR